VFAITAFCGAATDIFNKSYMFEQIDGRVVIVKQNGAVITDDELDKLASSTGATSVLHYDALLDQAENNYAWYEYGGKQKSIAFDATYEKNFGKNIVGRYPSAANEVFLSLPISYKPHFGEKEIKIDKINYLNLSLKVTGVKYYYDNNITPECLFTKEGFDIVTAVLYLQRASSDTSITLTSKNGTEAIVKKTYGIVADYGMEANKLYINDREINNLIQKDGLVPSVLISANFNQYDYYYGTNSQVGVYKKEFDSSYISATATGDIDFENNPGYIVVGVELVKQIVEEYLAVSYRQASLFYENNKQAYAKLTELKAAGYIAVPSDTTYTPNALETILVTIIAMVFALIWVMAIIFFAFFISLCLDRTLSAFKSEMAIMRSMGIQVKVIRIGMYIRMLISLIPAIVLMIATAILVFTSPKFNGYFTYLYFWQYLLIFLGMLILTVRVTHKQIRKLFGETVKKSLKGGERE